MERKLESIDKQSMKEKKKERKTKLSPNNLTSLSTRCSSSYLDDGIGLGINL